MCYYFVVIINHQILLYNIQVHSQNKEREKSCIFLLYVYFTYPNKVMICTRYL